MHIPLTRRMIGLGPLAAVALSAVLFSQAGCHFLGPAQPPNGQRASAGRDAERGQAGESQQARAAGQGTGAGTGRDSPDIDPVEQAAPKQSRVERQRQIDELVAQALTAPQLNQRTVAALRASDNAVAPLSDTVAAIEAAERVVVTNLRNADTVGYKSVRYSTGSEGRGIVIQLDTTQGPMERTGRPLDIGIQGEGFFQIHTGAGAGGVAGGVGFTRNGNFVLNTKGELVLSGSGSEGYRVTPPISIPAEATDITISQDGMIDVHLAGQPAVKRVGQVMLSRFINPYGLRNVGGGMYVESESSGPAIESKPGDGGSGSVLQCYLEGSNVDLTRERLRLRFLHNWRETIFRAIDGDPAKPSP